MYMSFDELRSLLIFLHNLVKISVCELSRVGRLQEFEIRMRHSVTVRQSGESIPYP